MMRTIDARIVQGARAATKNLPHQLRELIKQFPEIKSIHPASINVHLREPLYVQKWDHVTPTPIRWWDAPPGINGFQWEKFGFLRIEFEYPLNGPLTRAWIIDCYNSRAHSQPQLFEIIAELIKGVSYLQPCRIRVPDSAL